MAYRVYNKKSYYLGDDVNVVFNDHQSLLLEPVESHQEEKKNTNEESDINPTSDDEAC